MTLRDTLFCRSGTEDLVGVPPLFALKVSESLCLAIRKKDFIRLAADSPETLDAAERKMDELCVICCLGVLGGDAGDLKKL
jgi:hypothetical protein